MTHCERIYSTTKHFGTGNHCISTCSWKYFLQCCGSESGTKNQDLDPGSRSGMNNPYHISESLKTIFWVIILKFFDVDSGTGFRNGKNSDPGFGMEKSRIRDQHPGSAILFFHMPLFTGRIRDSTWSGSYRTRSATTEVV
jgi:hypothetical protein